MADAVGGPQFRLGAEPAPPEDLTVRVTIAFPDCGAAQSSESVTIPAGESHAVLTVTTVVEVGADGCEVVATVAPGDGYEVGAAAGASASVTLRPVTPVVTVTADSETVPEGSPVSFTLTAAPVPAADLTVSVSWSEEGSFLTASAPRTDTVTISPFGTAKLEAQTDDDEEAEADGSVTVTVRAGNGDGYKVGEPGSATVRVTDDDPATRSPAPATPGPAIPGPAVPAPTTPFPTTPTPTTPSPTPEDTTPTTAVTITGPDAAPHENISHARVVTVDEGEVTSFTLTAMPAPASDLTVTLSWRFETESFSFLENNDLMVTPRPPTVTIPTSGSASFTVTAGDDNEKQFFSPTLDLISVWPGDGYERGDKHRLFFYIEDDD